jgi:hypothetical protein
MRYILKAESDDRRGVRRKLYCITAGSAVNQPISPQVQISDPVLDGEPRMVKRGSDEIVQAVYINGVRVVCGGEVSDRLGREKLGTVLFPC